MEGHKPHRAKTWLRDCQFRWNLNGDTELADTNRMPHNSEDFRNLGGDRRRGNSSRKFFMAHEQKEKKNKKADNKLIKWCQVLLSLDAEGEMFELASMTQKDRCSLLGCRNGSLYLSWQLNQTGKEREDRGIQTQSILLLLGGNV